MLSHTHPGLNQYHALKKLPGEQSIDQLVQVRLRAEAVYPDGDTRPAAEAYDTYCNEVFGVLHRVGARSVWRGRSMLTLIGPETEQWDESYIVRFPSVDAYRDVLGDDEYIGASVHWNACVEDCRVYCLAVEPGLGL